MTQESESEKHRDKDKAELYAKLADSAWLRFHSRRDIEWKSAVGIWSAFGATTLGVFASTATFGLVAFMVIVIIVLAILGVYRFVWLPYIAEAMRRDQLCSYYWETGIQQIAGRSIRPALEPGAMKSGLWRKMPEAGAPNPPEQIDTQFEKEMRALHKSQWCQFSITLLFGLLLVAAVGIRAFSSSCISSKLTIEGQIDAEKLKITR